MRRDLKYKSLRSSPIKSLLTRKKNCIPLPTNSQTLPRITELSQKYKEGKDEDEREEKSIKWRQRNLKSKGFQKWGPEEREEVQQGTWLPR